MPPVVGVALNARCERTTAPDRAPIHFVHSMDPLCCKLFLFDTKLTDPSSPPPAVVVVVINSDSDITDKIKDPTQ